MCGIVGYIGPGESAPILMNSLRRLEYRGYDSAGLAVLNGDGLSVIKRKGKLAELEAVLDGFAISGGVGIGHTRWATHGEPSEANAHPHLDCASRIALVHNGIIENFAELKERLKSRGHFFRSETDTETIGHLIEENYAGDLLDAVKASVGELKGSFAIAVLSVDHPEEIVVARKDSPLILGLGDGELLVASDIPAVIDRTKTVVILEDGEIARLTRDGCTIMKLDGTPVERKAITVTWDAEAAEKAGYEDFMLKEIYEQPVAVRETLRPYVSSEGGISLGGAPALSEEEINSLDKVYIVACGTSYHAALVGKRVIESWACIPVEVDISSEFRYRPLLLNPGNLVIAITQSGETADTLASMKISAEMGAKVMAIANVVGSSATRLANATIYTHAGPEIGVAATKTFVSQLASLYVLALYLAKARKAMPDDEVLKIARELRGLPDGIGRALESSEEIKNAAERFATCGNFLFLGRGFGLPVALEGALKLKEISYIHAEGYAAGEMKHGPIALIDESCPVVVVATEGRTYEKVMSNVQEVRARGASVIAVASEGNEEINRYAEHVFFVPRTSEELSAAVAVVPLQLLAYDIAKLRGCDVDQPRNLAKSVTVE